MTAADQEDVHRTIERIAREPCGGLAACLASHNTGCGGCIRFEIPQDHELPQRLDAVLVATDYKNANATAFLQ
jgi:hypothetical protein